SRPFPLFSFFFRCYPPHRALHSFPTRRSSDLRVHHREVEAVALADARPVRDARAAERIRADTHARGADGLHVDHRGQVVDVRAQDRKSTRLNSSHRTISYAVFCLKKKK